VKNGLAPVVLFLDRDFVWLDEFGFRVWLEVLNHALRHEEYREHETERQQQVISDAHEVHPEVAKRLRRVPCYATHQRSGESNAHSGGGKIVNGQRNHLGEVGHGRFATVTLPVSVCGEADSGIEREM